eukprot:TRINITY_DN15931_c0_g1_i1.p1 TRINITY_DN15931_c0_g1~~TRINITY_DN15931_c0_g1_i1.p1  ORF type:complete len:373 (+),score=55.68 TRINITY_DN15931_c0_g1_i1:34-1152(+)
MISKDEKAYPLSNNVDPQRTALVERYLFPYTTQFTRHPIPPSLPIDLPYYRRTEILKEMSGPGCNVVYDDGSHYIRASDGLSYFGVKDRKYDDKYLLMTLVPTGDCMGWYAFGAIVRFNKDGDTFSKKVITRGCIFNYDSRNLITSKSQSMFLYDDSLVFVMNDRNTSSKEFIIHFVILNTFTAITPTIIARAQAHLSFGGSVSLKEDKFVLLESVGGDCVMIDITSVREVEGSVYYKCYVAKEKGLLEAVEAERMERYEYFEGYPIRCRICKAFTCTMTLCLKGGVQVSFGHGFCKFCVIRYSSSEERWKCCRPVMSSVSDRMGPCGMEMGDGVMVCPREHLDVSTRFSLRVVSVVPYIREGGEMFYEVTQ